MARNETSLPGVIGQTPAESGATVPANRTAATLETGGDGRLTGAELRWKRDCGDFGDGHDRR
jgi:hypothetical protein